MGALVAPAKGFAARCWDMERPRGARVMSQNRILESVSDGERFVRLRALLEAMGYTLDESGDVHPGRPAASSLAEAGPEAHSPPAGGENPLHRILEDWREAERRLALASDDASRAAVEREVGRLRREYQVEAHTREAER
jgi:hypothetical protein